MLEIELKVIPVSPVSQEDPSSLGLQHIIEQRLPILFKEEKRKNLLSLLPILKMLENEETPKHISVVALMKYRMGAFPFIFNLITQWLLPGKRLDVVHLYAVDFRIVGLGEDVLTLAEFNLHIENIADLDTIRSHFSILSNDALLGLSSALYARKIMEVRGAPLDQKTVLLQQQLSLLIRRLPEHFTSDLLTEMQHILVHCYDDFKTQRRVSHLKRLVASHYLFRKNLLKIVKINPQERLSAVKIFKAIVDFPTGQKDVVALNVGLNFLHEKEVVEQRHLLRAVKKYIPSAEVIDQTFLSNRKGGEQIATFYVELEKSNSVPFSLEEIKILKKELPSELQHHIAKLMLPVFMPRNEEEIMRNILSLGAQLKYVRDLPQVFLSFDEQTERNLFFTVIFVRILKGDEKSIHDSLKIADSFLRTLHDRTKVIGYVRKKYPKEATVFRVKFPKENFIRGDHSIDLYKARQAVVNELSRVFGEFRDFNGGMISKQNELLSEVKATFGLRGVKYNEILLEKFFFSLTPVIMRTVLEASAFETLFQMLMEEQGAGVPPKMKYRLHAKYETDFSFLILSSAHRNVLDEAHRVLHKFQHSGGDLIQGYLKTSSGVFMGYIFRCLDVHKQAAFRATIDELALA